MASELTRRDFLRALAVVAGAMVLPTRKLLASRAIGQPLLSRASWVPGLWVFPADGAPFNTSRMAMAQDSGKLFGIEPSELPIRAFRWSAADGQ